MRFPRVTMGPGARAVFVAMAFASLSTAAPARADETTADSATVDAPRDEIEAKPRTTVVAPTPDADEGAPPRTWWTAQRTAGVELGGIGVGSTIAGAIFGAVAIGNKSDASAHCTRGAPVRCDSIGLGLRGNGMTAGIASTVALVVGGAALVGGIVLIATAPASRAEHGMNALRLELSPRVGPTTAGLTLHGEW